MTDTAPHPNRLPLAEPVAIGYREDGTPIHLPAAGNVCIIGRTGSGAPHIAETIERAHRDREGVGVGLAMKSRSGYLVRSEEEEAFEPIDDEEFLSGLQEMAADLKTLAKGMPVEGFDVGQPVVMIFIGLPLDDAEIFQALLSMLISAPAIGAQIIFTSQEDVHDALINRLGVFCATPIVTDPRNSPHAQVRADFAGVPLDEAPARRAGVPGSFIMLHGEGPTTTVGMAYLA